VKLDGAAKTHGGGLEIPPLERRLGKGRFGIGLLAQLVSRRHNGSWRVQGASAQGAKSS